MTRRLTVLVQAYACNPLQGSEEGVGWGWVKAISRHHDLHVLTAEYHRSDIETQLREEPHLQERIQFHYVPAKRWHYSPVSGWVAIENSALKPLMHIAYRLWQKDAYKMSLELSKTTSFDLVHVITYVGFRFPGSYWKLPYPLVWGPVGGLENTPWRYFPVLGLHGSIMFGGRNLWNAFDRTFLPGPKKAFRKAGNGVISATSGIQEEIKARYGIESIVRCEIGTDGMSSSSSITRRQPDEPLEIVWSGLHIARKALPLLLVALSELPEQVNWRLTVLGSGPLTKKWRAIARSLDISNNIVWSGKVSRESAIERMTHAHVMAITSVYDLTSSVVIEALSVGLPVICPNHFGFRDAVNDSCGVRVEVTSLQRIREGIKKAILELYMDESYRQRLSHGAKIRSGDFSWEKLGELVSGLYREKVVAHSRGTSTRLADNLETGH